MLTPGQPGKVGGGREREEKGLGQDSAFKATGVLGQGLLLTDA